MYAINEIWVLLFSISITWLFPYSSAMNVWFVHVQLSVNRNECSVKCRQWWNIAKYIKCCLHNVYILSNMYPANDYSRRRHTVATSCRIQLDRGNRTMQQCRSIHVRYYWSMASVEQWHRWNQTRCEKRRSYEASNCIQNRRDIIKQMVWSNVVCKTSSES